MSQESSELILLDTHVWIWMMGGHERLESPLISAALEGGVRGSHLRVAAISLWEAAHFAAEGKIGFGISVSEWLKRATSAPGISVAALNMDIAAESTQLPGRFKGDQADSLIVATARILKAVLVTGDPAIEDYSRQGYVKILSV